MVITDSVLSVSWTQADLLTHLFVDLGDGGAVGEEDTADVSVSVPRGQVQREAAPTVLHVGRALVSEE